MISLGGGDAAGGGSSSSSDLRFFLLGVLGTKLMCEKASRGRRGSIFVVSWVGLLAGGGLRRAAMAAMGGEW